MGSPAAAESFGLVALGARQRAAPAVAAAAVPGLAALPEDSRPSSGFPRPEACSGSAGRAGAAEAGGCPCAKQAPFAALDVSEAAVP